MPKMVVLFALLLVAGTGRADEEAEAPASYTAAELAALDVALHAANLDRVDLTFRKDLTEGKACLPVVRAMLRDPLKIAPEIDAFAAQARALDEDAGAPLGLLCAAFDRLAPIAQENRSSHALVRRLRALPPRSPRTTADLVAELRVMVARTAPLEVADAEWKQALATRRFDDDRYRVLRRYLPETMAWHEVFASPYSEEEDRRLAKLKEAGGDAYVHDLAAQIPVDALAHHWVDTFRDPVVWLKALPIEAFPKNKPLVHDTPFGRIALGTPGDDTYTGNYAALIDPGGNDRYAGCRIGAADGTSNRTVGFFADLGGNDVYACADIDITLGAAVMGVAAFFDLGAGNDRYRGGHASLGAAMGGVAVFHDDGGSDTYEGRTFTQGAAGFGVAVFSDDSVQPRPAVTADEGTKDPVDIALFDNDRLSAWANAQAFARCRGIAICANARGNDTYEAGGVYLHAPLFSDRYQSFSQGFAIGERGIDYAGGYALVLDREGNDRYLGDVYNQGVGYWYGAGLLRDGAGNDLYEMTQYGQGSGIHLAVGGLVDASGSDTYVMHSGLGQGGSHDYAASILHDRGGNDRYLGMTSCNGTGLTNSVGIHIDRAGNDTYAGRRGSLNTGRPARGFSSVGVLVDLGGEDHYLGIMEDGGIWRQADLGVGVDETPVAKGTPAKPAPNEPLAPIPEICSYEGELTQAVFDELWAIAIRWEVGENRRIVPVARKRLVAFGTALLPYLDRAMDQDASGLELRAYADVLGGLAKGGAAAEVTAFLRKNLRQEGRRRPRVALWLAGEMKAAETEAEVVALLDGADRSLARRAAGVLARIGSHAGDETLLAWLRAPDDELAVQAALGTLLGLDTDCYAAARPLLDHPLVSVRSRLAALLGVHDMAYAADVLADLRADELGRRARRTLLDALVRMPPKRAAAAAGTLAALLADEDWGTRADAARALRHALDPKGADAEQRAAITNARKQRLATETHPYVRRWLEEPR
ncbi:MAG: HEAT repeat domain-containing protein [Planctomycetota bacterium]|jgi:hypothetical protein